MPLNHRFATGAVLRGLKLFFLNLRRYFMHLVSIPCLYTTPFRHGCGVALKGASQRGLKQGSANAGLQRVERVSIPMPLHSPRAIASGIERIETLSPPLMGYSVIKVGIPMPLQSP
jgi:hypothetical protein